MNTSVNSNELRDHALAIWKAGVEAVKPARLLAAKTKVEGSCLAVDGTEIDFTDTRKLIVVGAGKASGNLAIEFDKQVISKLRQAKPELQVEGWINCPEGSFPTNSDAGDIKLFEARPAGKNEPTEKSVYGTQRIIELVSGCREDDVVICLLSGGGSALLVAPATGVTLADKQAVARVVAAAGANIDQLNAIRRALSEVKGGGLARACRAGKLLSLIISDVLGDSLETIASGPTLLEASASSQAALAALDTLGLTQEPQLQNVVAALEKKQQTESAKPNCAVEHVILGNNADAVDAAGQKAVELGYRYVMESANQSEGDVLELADRAVQVSRQLLEEDGVDCWISGGEPTVQLPKTQKPGKGGRNQQLALSLMDKLVALGWPASRLHDPASTNDEDVQDQQAAGEFAFVSGGTDGEDGPTDAAGAVFDRELLERSTALKLDRRDFLTAANAYVFFEQTGGLILTGPTGTNVCDLRVALARKT